MTFQDFILRVVSDAVFLNKGIDTDGAYGNQCMDLMHAYIKDVLGLSYSELAAPTAAQAYLNYPNVPGADKFMRIANTPTGIPIPGDIVFFKQYGNLYGQAGHVCIAYRADMMKLCTLDQNWPTYSLPHLQKHTYSGCLGWLRRR